MSTEERHTCPACGAIVASDAAEGLCAKCVVAVMLNFGQEDIPEPGDPLGEIGDYEILDKLAAGGMGVVYRARQKGMGRLVALKLVAEGKLASKVDKERFLIEARAAGELDHPNIVPVYEVGEEQGQYFFSMRLVTGGNLADWFRQWRDTDRTANASELSASVQDRQTAVARLLIKVARAVDFAHAHGILHRDLKPANILIDQHGEPQISDFGLAKRVREDSTLTASGQLLGSPAYMAPEQAGGKRDELSPAADIYAIGVILYEALAGRVPFAGESPMALLQESLTKEPRPLRKLNPRIDRDLETIALCCLEKAPHDRYASAEALAKDLQRWMEGCPIEAKAAGPVRRFQKWTRRKPAMAALVALAIVTSGSIGTLTWRHERERLAQTVENYVQGLARAKASIDEKRLVEARSILTQLPQEQRDFAWRWLWKRCAPRYDSLFLNPPFSSIHTLAASPQVSNQLLVQTPDGAVLKWTPGDAPPAEPAFTLGKPPAPESFLFHGGGGLLLGKRPDGAYSLTVAGRTLAQGKLPDTLIPPRGGYLAAAPGTRPTLFLTTGGRRGDAVRTWSPPWQEPRIRFHLSDDLLAMALSPRSQQEKRHYAAFCYRTKLELWQWETDGVFFRDKAVQRSPSPQALLSFSPNGRLIVESDLSGFVRIRNRKSPSLEITGEEQLDEPIQVLTTFDAHGIHRIATASGRGEIRAWNMSETDDNTADRHSDAGWERLFGLAADGSAAVGIKDGQITLSRFAAGGAEDRSLGPVPGADPVIGLGLLDANIPAVVVLIQQADGNVQVRNLIEGTLRSHPKRPLVEGGWIDQWVDGHYWTLLRPPGRAEVYNLRTGQRTSLGTVSTSGSKKWRIFGRDPALLCHMKSNVITWRDGLRGGKGRINLQTSSPIENLAVSPDERTVAATHADGYLRLWQAASGRLLLELDNHPWDFITFSPDGAALLAHESGGNLHVWDARPASKIRP